MKTLNIFLLSLVFSCTAYSQVITFEKSYPYFSTESEGALQVIQTKDKGYALRVSTNASGLFSIRYGGVIKTDSLGTKVWEYRFVIPQYGSFEYIAETKDSGIIVALFEPTDTSGVGNNNIRLTKLNSSGQHQWTSLITSQFATSMIKSIEIVQNNKILISSCGYGNSDLILVGSLGGLLKWKHYPNIIYIDEFIPVGDTLFKAIADRDSANYQLGFLNYVTLNDSGELIASTSWQYDIDSISVFSGGKWGTLSKKGEGFSFGHKKNVLGNWELNYFFKFDTSGAMVINRKSNFDRVHLNPAFMIPTNDGGFMMAGGILNNNGSLGYSWLYRFDENGDSLWFKYIANAYNSIAYFADVVQIGDSGFIAAGGIKPANYREPYLVRTDNFGNVFNLLALKHETVAAQELDLFPNPAQSLLQVRCSDIAVHSVFEIRDLSGKLLLQETLKPDSAKDALLQIDLNTLNPGFYMCRIITDERMVAAKKLVVTR